MLYVVGGEEKGPQLGRLTIPSTDMVEATPVPKSPKMVYDYELTATLHYNSLKYPGPTVRPIFKMFMSPLPKLG